MMNSNCIMSSCDENEQATTTYKNMDESDKHNIKGNKPETKKYMF